MNILKKALMWIKIPRGIYCDGCPYWHFIRVREIYKESNCQWKDDCKELCGLDNSHKCKCNVIKCDYLDFIDSDEKTLLWDGCKECGVKNNR